MVGRIIGDYRGNYKTQGAPRPVGSLLTGVISPVLNACRADFLVFLGLKFGK